MCHMLDASTHTNVYIYMHYIIIYVKRLDEWKRSNIQSYGRRQENI